MAHRDTARVAIDLGQGVTCARTDLHRELERLAVGPGEGPPAVVRLGSKVVNCNPQEGSLTLSDGSMVRSDLVLGADGISVSSPQPRPGHSHTIRSQPYARIFWGTSRNPCRPA